MAGGIFHVCRVTRSSSSIKRGFPTHEEQFPSFNLPYAYFGYVHLFYQPTTKFQALPSLSVSVLKHVAAGSVQLESQQPVNAITNIQMQQLPKHIP